MITPYKNRVIDERKPVSVYFNLHLKVWSIKQDTLVVAHASELTISSVTPKVNESGRQRVIRERKKNVHAFLNGYITPIVEPKTSGTMYYNPYKVKQFVDGDTMQPITHANLVVLKSDRTVQYA